MLLIEVSGWLVAALIVVTIGVAVFARRHLDQHFWIGYAIASLAFVHAALSMGALTLSGAAALTGVMVATVAMFVSWAQVPLGTRLRASEGRRRATIRVVHIATAVTLVGLGTAHILLNGPIVRTLLGL